MCFELKLLCGSQSADRYWNTFFDQLDFSRGDLAPHSSPSGSLVQVLPFNIFAGLCRVYRWATVAAPEEKWTRGGNVAPRITGRGVQGLHLYSITCADSFHVEILSLALHLETFPREK